MLTITHQLTLGAIGVFGALCILFCLRKNVLHVQQAVWWAIAAAGLAFGGLFPGVFDAVGHFLGVTYPPTLFLTLAVVVLLLRLLWADMERCRLLIQIRQLARHQAALSLRLNELEQRLTTHEDAGSDTRLAQSGEARDA